MSTILLLGGSGGIGQEIIRLLLEKKHIIINVDACQSNVKSPCIKEVICRLNIDNVTEVIDKVLSCYDVDVLISSIGYYGIKTMHDFSLEDYKKSMDINVTIPMLASVRTVEYFKNRSSGKIILLSSAAAYVGSRDLGYSAAKAAVNGLVHGLAKNLAGCTVYVYGIAPGIIATNMSNNMSEERQNDAVERTLNKRKGTALDVARAVRFLVEEDQGYMNGGILHINNGLYFN